MIWGRLSSRRFAMSMRLGLLVRLLGHDELAGMVRRGCRLVVLCWGRNAAGTRTVEVVALTPADFPERG
jgi:hypothetical protein